MKKALSLAAAAIMLAAAPTSVFAEETAAAPESVNLLNEYFRLDWTGDSLYYDENSKAMFFRHIDGKTAQQASYTVTFDGEAPAGMWFYTDIGNGSTGGDNGTVEISVSDKNGECLFSINSETVVNEDNFRRHYLGKETGYYPLGENSASVTVTLSANDVDGGNLVDVYFRNLCLMTGTKEQTDFVRQELIHLYSTDKLEKVEIGNYDFTRWLWIGIVFVVAFIFYLIRLRRKKYETPKILKPPKTYQK